MKHRTGKKFGALLLAAMIAFGTSMVSYAGSWKQDETGWWYQNDDGTYLVNTWYQDTDGSWYFLNEEGYMISNCYRVIDGTYYAFGSTGRWTGIMFTGIEAGAWDAGSYTNTWSGFSMNVPEGYQILTAEQTGLIGSSQTMVEFVVYVPDGTGSGVELEYMDAYDFPSGSATTLEYMVSWNSMMLALQGYTVESVTTVTMGGREYMKLTANNSGVVKHELYCRKVGDHYFECVTAVYWLASQNAMDTLMSSIY